MRSSTWHAEHALLLLMSGGFFVHLISASRHIQDSQAQVGDILLGPVDLALSLIMAYCSVALITRSGQFARTYDLGTTMQSLDYWAITAYVTLSLPGHAPFLLTGDTRFFDGFPGWISIVIMPVYVLVVGYVLTLRRRPVPRSGAAAADRSGTQQKASDHRAEPTPTSATS